MSANFAKFDSFLKRVLPNNEYKEVKTYEPCVVASAKKHAFRFTFITNEKICVTENPPKSILFQLNLKDVVAVNLIRDKALFLQSDLQDHVQHIVIKHHKEGNVTSNVDMSESDPSLGTSQTKQLNFTEDMPSTSVSNSVPMLCSYADVRTMSQSSRNVNERVAEVKTSKPSSRISRKQTANSKDSSWESRDPYLIQVARIEIETQDLHLYILNEKANFHMMLKSIWRSYIIYRSFLGSREGDGHRTSVDNRRTSSSPIDRSSDQTTRALFCDLQRELLCTDSVEHIYRLYYELKEASQRDILIKHLFWKDQSMLDRTVTLLSKFTKKSSLKLVDRSDEIELLVVMLRCLEMMLREIEAICPCYRVLKNLSRSQLCSLIDCVIHEPVLLSNSWLIDDDMKSLLHERVLAGCGVMHQLIEASGQAQWIVNGLSGAFNMTLLFKVINDNSNLQRFLDNLLKACVVIWKSPINRRPSNSQSFSSEEAIDAFHMFTVMHRIITRSSAATDYARSSFQEEFRYYITPTSVAQRFPLTQSISGMARAVIHATGTIITKK